MDLNEMRLPELWTLYAEVVGEESRCPNRKYLVRRITEARAAAVSGVPDAHEAASEAVVPEAAAIAQSAALVDNAQPAEAVAGQNGAVDHDVVVDGAGGNAADDPDEQHDDAAADDAIPDLSVATPELRAVKLTRLSVDDLRLLYRTVFGRETSSFSARYLVVRLREARRGKIKGGATKRASVPKGDVVVLPLRMAKCEVEELDKVWRGLGFASRTAFLRRASRSSPPTRQTPPAALHSPRCAPPRRGPRHGRRSGRHRRALYRPPPRSPGRPIRSPPLPRRCEGACKRCSSRRRTRCGPDGGRS